MGLFVLQLSIFGKLGNLLYRDAERIEVLKNWGPPLAMWRACDILVCCTKLLLTFPSNDPNTWQIEDTIQSIFVFKNMTGVLYSHTIYVCQA